MSGIEGESGTPPGGTLRRSRGARAHRRGVDAEGLACRALQDQGWAILGRRLRTPAGEVDIVARRADLLAFIEVKARPTLSQAAFALSPRQARRLMMAAEILLALNPDWASLDVRFDMIMVDARGQARRTIDVARAM